MLGKSFMKHVTVPDSLLLSDALVQMRNKKTDMDSFRRSSYVATHILLEKVIDKKVIENINVETPVGKTKGKKIKDALVLIGVLRSGIAMLRVAMELFPKARVGFAGIYRDEITALPQEYYWKAPVVRDKDEVIICDPMIATGGTLVGILRKFKKDEIKRIKIVSLVASPQGIAAIHEEFPGIKIIVGSVDEKLNANKYIVPGLGDFGDRYFGTL